jgi:hypothetical protein
MFARKMLLSKEIPRHPSQCREKVMLAGHHLISIKYWTSMVFLGDSDDQRSNNAALN